MYNKVEIEIDILNLMHIYATLSDFIKAGSEKTNSSTFNFTLLKRAFEELEKQISHIYTEEHGDVCEKQYKKLKKQFNNAK
jgi:hypothetical protein